MANNYHITLKEPMYSFNMSVEEVYLNWINVHNINLDKREGAPFFLVRNLSLVKSDSPLVIFILVTVSSNFVTASSQFNTMGVEKFTSGNMTEDNGLVYAPELF